jgi:4-hydroxybenzoate polyprenyltransferase
MSHSAIPYSHLYVDLDGTLLRTDTLWEQVLLLFRRPWLLIGALYALLKGKGSFKAYCLRNAGIPDIGLLPLNQEVMDIIHLHNEAGVPVFLATASLREVACEVSRIIPGIAGIIASTPELNLKSENKAQAILEHAEGKAFGYIGNDSSDIAVWRCAKGVFYVGSTPSITKTLLNDHDTLTIIDGGSYASFSSYIRQIRLYQWIKNTLVFLPAFLAHTLHGENAILLSVTFLVFGLMASSVYVLNDLIDLQSDRIHPNKKKRPLASGDITIPIGLAMYIGLLASSLVIGFIFLHMHVMYVLLGYALTTTFYSIIGKRIAILDVMILAGLYTMRLIAGAETVNVPLSEWFLGFSMFFFVSLAFVKRYAEILSRKESRILIPGRGYSTGDGLILLISGLISAMLSVLVLALYINSDAVIRLYAHPHYLWVICPAILAWLLQLWFLAHRGKMHDDPIITMARTPMTYIVLFIIVFTILAATV